MLWIDHYICWWKNLFSHSCFIGIKWHIMMIRNDHCQSMSFAVCNCISCCNPIITGKDRINLVFHCFFNDIFINSIAIFHAVWNLKINLSTKIMNRFPQNII